MATEIWQWQTEANSQRNQEKRTFKNGLQNAEKCGQKFDATAGSHAEGPWSLILGAWPTPNAADATGFSASLAGRVVKVII